MLKRDTTVLLLQKWCRKNCSPVAFSGLPFLPQNTHYIKHCGERRKFFIFSLLSITSSYGRGTDTKSKIIPIYVNSKFLF